MKSHAAMPCKEIPYPHVAECHQRWRKRGNWILMVQLHTLYRVKSSSLWDRIPRCLLHFLGCIQSCLFNPPSFWQIQFLSILDSCSKNAYSSWWRGKMREVHGIKFGIMNYIHLTCEGHCAFWINFAKVGSSIRQTQHTQLAEGSCGLFVMKSIKGNQAQSEGVS